MARSGSFYSESLHDIIIPASVTISRREAEWLVDEWKEPEQEESGPKRDTFLLSVDCYAKDLADIPLNRQLSSLAGEGAGIKNGTNIDVQCVRDGSLALVYRLITLNPLAVLKRMMTFLTSLGTYTVKKRGCNYCVSVAIK